MVDRRLDDDFLVLFDKHVDGHADALDNAGDIGEPFALHLPSVTVGEPAHHCGPIFRRLDGVAEERVVKAAAQGVGDKRGGLEVHVGDP